MYVPAAERSDPCQGLPSLFAQGNQQLTASDASGLTTSRPLSSTINQRMVSSRLLACGRNQTRSSLEIATWARKVLLLRAMRAWRCVMRR